LSLWEEFVAVFNDLMSSAYQVHIVFLEEARDDVRPKGERNTTIVFTPASDIFVRIWPEEITEKTAIGNLALLANEPGPSRGKPQKKYTHISGAHDAANLLHGVQVRTETSVHGKDLLIDDGRNGQAIEAIGECLPKLDVVSSLALVIKSVDAVDGGAFMVSSKNEEVFWVLDLVGQEQADSLEWLLASIYVVAQKEVIGFGRESTVFEKAKEIVVLAVNVTTDLTHIILVCCRAEWEHKPVATGRIFAYLDGSLEL
jgi:hypothetical protein